MAERWVGDWRERATPEQVEMIKRICLDSYASALNFTPNARQIPDIRADLIRTPKVAASAGWCMTTQASGDVMAKQVVLWLGVADLWWCSADVRDLVEVASESMPDQQLAVEDPPSDAGLLVMESPFSDADGDIPDIQVATNAFLWFKGWQSRPESPEPRPVLQILSFAWQGDRGWITTGVESWPVGETHADANTPSDIADRARIATIWTLARQERVVPQCVVSPSRPVARRIKAAGLPPEAGSVRALDIRRPSGGSTVGAGGRDFSHRWIVNGHWRNQWLPSRKTHRVQWIAPYVKGPEDKPLVVREDVRVVR